MAPTDVQSVETLHACRHGYRFSVRKKKKFLHDPTKQALALDTYVYRNTDLHRSHSDNLLLQASSNYFDVVSLAKIFTSFKDFSIVRSVNNGNHHSHLEKKENSPEIGKYPKRSDDMVSWHL